MSEKKHPKYERTVFIIKPDGVQRGLIGEIISRLETRGLKIIAMQMIQPTRDQIDKHYPSEDTWIARIGEKTLETYKENGLNAKEEIGTDVPLEIGNMAREWILDFMSSGPVVKMVVEGVHARAMIRKLAGATMPASADMGSIRGDFSVDSAAAANRDRRSVRNLVHASETQEEYDNEFALWFTDEDVHEYDRSDDGIVF